MRPPERAAAQPLGQKIWNEQRVGRHDPGNAAARDAVDLRANLLLARAVDRVRSMAVRNERNVVPAALGFADRRVDAELRLHPAHDEMIGGEAVEDLAEVRFAERVAKALRDARVARVRRDRAGDLPRRGSRNELLIFVAHVDDGRSGNACAGDQARERAEKLFTASGRERVHERLLDIDDEKDRCHAPLLRSHRQAVLRARRATRSDGTNVPAYGAAADAGLANGDENAQSTSGDLRFGGCTMLTAAIRTMYRRVAGRDANVSDVPLMLLRRVYGERAVVKTKIGFPILVDTRDRYGAFRFWRTGIYEPSETAFLLRFARPGLRVLDVGANIGYFSVLLGRAAGNAGKVIAFEPSAKTAAIFRSNLELNGLQSIVEVHQAAAGAQPSIATFYIDRDHASNNALYDHKLTGAGDRETQEVSVVRIDDVAAGLIPLDIMKIDVEGAEVEALRGARETLRSSPDAVILCEIAPRWLLAAGHRPNDVIDEIVAFGFEAYELSADGALVPIDPYARAAHYEAIDGGANFVFMQPQAAAAFAAAGRVIVAR